MRNRNCKPNPALGAGLLLFSAGQMALHSGFLPENPSCFLTGLSLGLMLLGLHFADETRAARLRAWKHNLFKGGDRC